MTITTAQSHPLPRLGDNRLQQALAALCAAVWMWAAISPVSRFDWILENLLVFTDVGLLVWIYRRRPLSDLASIFIAAFFVLHVVGSHYTYSLVPLGDWVKDAMGLERNHYDRVVHFAFGLLLAYPIRELLRRAEGAHLISGRPSAGAGTVRATWAAVFTFTILATCSGLYEVLEWVVGAIVDPEAGMAFLGTQGDVFDAQKDSALATIGAMFALVTTELAERAPHPAAS